MLALEWLLFGPEIALRITCMLASPPDSGPRGPPFYMFSRIPYTFILIEMIRIVIGLLHFPLPSRDVSWPSQPSLCVCTSFPSQQLQKQYWPGSIHPPLAVLLKIVFNNCVYREPQDGRSWQEMNTVGSSLQVLEQELFIHMTGILSAQTMASNETCYQIAPRCKSIALQLHISSCIWTISRVSRYRKTVK